MTQYHTRHDVVVVQNEGFKEGGPGMRSSGPTSALAGMGKLKVPRWLSSPRMTLRPAKHVARGGPTAHIGLVREGTPLRSRHSEWVNPPKLARQRRRPAPSHQEPGWLARGHWVGHQRQSGRGAELNSIKNRMRKISQDGILFYYSGPGMPGRFKRWHPAVDL